MSLRWVVALSLSGLSGCGEPGQLCGGSDAKFYDEGLEVQLKKAGVPYRKQPGLCVDAKYKSEFRAAERELEKYYPQIAVKPKDDCEARALVSWAEKEKLRYDVRAARDAAGRPSGNLFLLRAFTAEELRSFREKLDASAPIGSCGLKPLQVAPGELKWTTTGWGYQMAQVVGDPTKEGMYLARVKFPAGLKVQPHFHPDERIVTVVSGTLLFGYGARFDERTMRTMPAGSVWTEPANQPHYAWAKNGEAVVEVVGSGPSGVTPLPQEAR